jgi:hypothetical protein
MAMTAIVETEVTGIAGKRTPRESLERPLTRLKKEPALVVDVSGSNLEQAAPDSSTTKVELLTQAIPLIAGVVEGDDAEAQAEQAGGSSDKGGLRTIAANEPREIHFDKGEDESTDERDLGDINTANAPQKMQRIVQLVNQQGRTFLMPAIRAIKRAFDTEFPGDTQRCLELLIINDGKVSDEAELEEWVAKNAGPRCVIVVAIIGYDDVPSAHGHDAAVTGWQKIAAGNKFVTVDALTGVSDPREVAYDLQFMGGLAD